MNQENVAEKKSESPLHVSWYSEGGEVVIDDELYIREAFEIDPARGCTLVFKKYFSPLCNHVVRFVYSKSVAEDIVSEIFCKFWENSTYRLVKNFRYYLFCSARNRALTYVRLQFKQVTDIEDEDLADDNSSRMPELFTAFEELQNCLKKLVEKMPPQRRTAFILSRFEGKSNAEVANEMRISVKAVEGHMTMALEYLRKGLKDYDVTPKGK